MRKSIGFWQFIGFIFVSVTGTLLHFLYDWTNQSVVSGLFSAVNESIWEHMKLLYVPLLAFAIFEGHFLKKTVEHFWCVKLVGFILGLVVIPVLYYTYTGALGVSADWFNITIFFIATAVAFISEALLFKNNRFCRLSSKVALVIIGFIGLAFIIFTFSPPKIPLFQDPLTGSFGI